MVVRSQCTGSRITGLYIGANNVRRYFPRKVASVDLQLDHLQIQCGLAPHFWNGQPEIQDPRLCDWLELKRMHDKAYRNSMPLAMIPSGENSFILSPADLNATGRARRPVQTAVAQQEESELAEAAVPA